MAHAVHRGVFDDTFWHRAAGVWMLDHHHVMRSDVFSYTVPGAKWITPEWGYDVLLAQSVRSVGPVAFWLLSAGLATLTVLAVAIRSRVVGAGWTWTGLLCVETGAAVTLFLDDRPQMVSYFFLALLLLLFAWPGAAGRGCWPSLSCSCCGPTCTGASPWASPSSSSRYRGGGPAPGVGRVTVSLPLPLVPMWRRWWPRARPPSSTPSGSASTRAALGITFNQQVRRLIAGMAVTGLP